MDANVVKEFLKKIVLFKDLSDIELELITNLIEIKTFEKDAFLFYENNPRKNLFVIYEGEVELFKRTPFGEEKRLAFFSRYDFIGEGALLDDSPHSTNARALLECTIFVLTREKFQSLIDDYGSIAVKIYNHVARVISRRMRQTNARVINIAAPHESGRTRIEQDL